jgi:hypothetical protein
VSSEEASSTWVCMTESRKCGRLGAGADFCCRKYQWVGGGDFATSRWVLACLLGLVGRLEMLEVGRQHELDCSALSAVSSGGDETRKSGLRR